MSQTTADTGLRRRGEHVLKPRASGAGPGRKDDENLRLIHELQVRQAELELQNEELRRTRDEAEKYLSLYALAPVGYFILDRNGIVSGTNLSGAALLGVDSSDLIGHSFSTFVAHDYRMLFTEFLAMVFDNLGKMSCEIALAKRGSFPLFLQMQAVAYESGQECRISVMDITERKKTEVALRESEERLRFHLNNSPMAVIEWDKNFIVTRWTGESEHTFGWSAAETIGKQLASLNMIHVDDIPIVAHAVATLTDGVSRQAVATYRNYTKNGDVRYCTWFNSVLVDQQGQMSSVLSQVIDITERVKAEQRLNLIADTASQLLVSDSPQELVESLCTKAMAVLDSHTFFNFLLDEGQGRLHLNACAGISDRERREIEWLDYGVAVCGCAARDACRIVVEDIPETVDSRTELVKSYGILAYACHPLMVKDRVLGTLSFGTRSRNRFSEEDLTLMKAVADQVAIAMERKLTAEALYVSHDNMEQRVVERTNELAASVKQLRVEVNGRESAQKNLRRLNKLYSVLTEANQAIVRVCNSNRDFDRDRNRGRNTLFRDFCRIAVKHGGFILAWIGLVDEETGEVRRLAASGETKYLDDIRITARTEPEGEGPTGIAVRNGTYCICNDFQNDPRTAPWHIKGRRHGINASAAIALKEEGRVVGVLTLYADEKNFFDRKQAELLVQMGADVSFALDSLARDYRRMQAEHALQEEALERLRAVEALRMQEHMLIQQNRHAAMGEMIGNIAHQWRQPLNTLGLFTQRLGVFYGSPSFNRELLETSVEKSMEIIQYMSRTIDDFRNFFSTQREKSDFKVDEAICMALSLVEANFKERRIKIEKEGEDEVMIHGFLNEYSQVLLNIFINARDAMSEHNIESPCLKINIGAENGRSLVTISDNAGGIPEEVIDKIFDPYFTTKGPQQGTGLGLFMSKAIIENNLGGRLTVRNSDAGAEFRIEV